MWSKHCQKWCVLISIHFTFIYNIFIKLIFCQGFKLLMDFPLFFIFSDVVYFQNPKLRIENLTFELLIFVYKINLICDKRVKLVPICCFSCQEEMESNEITVKVFKNIYYNNYINSIQSFNAISTQFR